MLALSLLLPIISSGIQFKVPRANEVFEIVNTMEDRAKLLGVDMRKGQPTPGNIKGELSSIEEKSLGAIIKSGTKTIEGVLPLCRQTIRERAMDQ